MTAPRFTKFTMRTAALGALLAGFTAVAGAQKAKPTTPPAGPPVTTKGATKANPKAAKGQATAESKRTEAREAKAARDADKAADKAERAALKAARTEPKELLKGIKLSDAERRTVSDIEKKYDGQLKDLEKQEDAAAKAGKPDPAMVARINALRMRERSDLRAALTPAQQTQFDKNMAALGAKH